MEYATSWRQDPGDFKPQRLHSDETGGETLGTRCNGNTTPPPRGGDRYSQ